MLGDEHPDTLRAAGNLGLLYGVEGKYRQAEPILTNIVEVSRVCWGSGHGLTVIVMNKLAMLYLHEGRYRQAESLFTSLLETRGRVLLEARRRVLGPEHPASLGTSALLGELRVEQHRYADAEALLRTAVNGVEKQEKNLWRRMITRACWVLASPVKRSAQKLSLCSFPAMKVC